MDEHLRLLFERVLKTLRKRLHMLSSGHENCPVPSSVEELVAWWQLPPP
jgi:hypothetical protein